MHVKSPGDLYKDKIYTHAFIERAIEHIPGFDLLPDVVLATGDLADLGSELRVFSPRDRSTYYTKINYLFSK